MFSRETLLKQKETLKKHDTNIKSIYKCSNQEYGIIVGGECIGLRS